MRVVHVCSDPGIPAFGTKGASVHVQAVLRVLVRAGAEVHLVCARPGGEPPADLAGVTVHALPRVSGDGPDRERSAARADAAVADLLDRLHARAPLDLVYERYSLWGRTATAWAQASGVPCVLEVNAPLVAEQARHRGLFDRVGAEQVARDAVRAADAVICVSRPVADWASAQGAVDPQVVPNGVDTRRVRPAQTPVRAAGAPAFTVGFVGTLKAWHGVETLVDAVAVLAQRSRSWRLLLVGDGPCAPALRERAQASGVADLVELTGAMDPASVPAQLHRMDIACAPYPQLDDFYFSPLKVYEYLAAGLPVVASAVGPLPGLLDGGRLGRLVRPGDVRALAAELDALRLDTPGRRRLRLAAIHEASRHDWDHVVARTLDLVGLELSEARHVA